MKSNRRNLIKALTLGGGVLSASKIPAAWAAPVVDSVLLPAHAQTTGGQPLFGSLDSPIVTRILPDALFRGFARAPEANDTLVDAFIGTAMALPPALESVTEIFGYAERDFGAGDAQWFIQLLLRDTYFEEVVQRTPNWLEGLVAPAHAGSQPAGPCIFEVLWETTVALNLPDGDKFRSTWRTDVPFTDACGHPITFTSLDADMRLEGADDPNNPSTAELAVRNVGEGSESFKIRLNLGGSRLSLNCGADACEFPA